MSARTKELSDLAFPRLSRGVGHLGPGDRGLQKPGVAGAVETAVPLDQVTVKPENLIVGPAPKSNPGAEARVAEVDG